MQVHEDDFTFTFYDPSPTRRLLFTCDVSVSLFRPRQSHSLTEIVVDTVEIWNLNST